MATLAADVHPLDRSAAASPKAVIIGGGFGGLAAAKDLVGSGVDVTLIDRRNHHLFQPLLYQVATAGLSPADIAYPIRGIVGDEDDVEVVLGDVVEIDVGGRAVVCDDGRRYDYDRLVVAAGAVSHYFGHPEWEQHAPGLKSLEDATELRARILGAFEEAELTSDRERRRALMTFVVIGGGPTGVEMAGAIAEIATTTLADDFHHIDPAETRVVLLEGADRLLTPFHPKLSAKAKRSLRHLGVEVWTGAFAEEIDAGGVTVTLDGGAEERLDAHTVVWGAGVGGAPVGATLADAAGVELSRGGRVPVGSDLSIAGHPEIFVVGDLADATSTDGSPVPGLAPAAQQGGRHAARCIAADLEGVARPAFRYLDKGSLATIGRSKAVAEFGKLRFSGLVAWVLWWAVHIALLIGFRSRVLVMFSWGWSWLTYNRGARLITRAWRPVGREAERESSPG